MQCPTKARGSGNSCHQTIQFRVQLTRHPKIAHSQRRSSRGARSVQRGACRKRGAGTPPSQTTAVPTETGPRRVLPGETQSTTSDALKQPPDFDSSISSNVARAIVAWGAAQRSPVVAIGYFSDREAPSAVNATSRPAAANQNPEPDADSKPVRMSIRAPIHSPAVGAADPGRAGKSANEFTPHAAV